MRVADDHLAIIKPIHVTVPDGCVVTGESRSAIYDAIKNGELTAVKDGHRTLLIYAELEARCAARPVGLPKEKPYLAAGRDAYVKKRAVARAKKQARKTSRRK